MQGNKSRGESYEMAKEPTTCADVANANGVQDEISTLQRLARVKVIAGLLENKTRMNTACIDRIARVLFPLGYTVFVISYFVSYMTY